MATALDTLAQIESQVLMNDHFHRLIKNWPKTTLDPLSSHCLLVIAVSRGGFAPEYRGIPGSPPSSEVVV
jgi:hypothetical protein